MIDGALNMVMLHILFAIIFFIFIVVMLVITFLLFAWIALQYKKIRKLGLDNYFKV
jgi:cell division septal protein FtsQ